MNKSILKVSVTALTLLALSAGVSFAASTNYGTNQCQPIYGGGESCVKTPQFEINKTVKNPQSGAFVDNLGVSDAKYRSGETVIFKITVRNTTGDTLKNVVVKDILPDFVDFVEGMGGTFDQNSKTLTIKIDSLAKDESRDFFVKVKVRGNDKLPSDQNIVCVVNQSIITVDNKTGQDNASVCIEKGVPTPTPTNPGNPNNPDQPSNPSNPSNPTQPGNPSNPTNPGNPTTTKGGFPTNPATVNPPTTKGGLPVYPPTKATKTPDTGPESLALFGLIPSAIGGMFLRRKSK